MPILTLTSDRWTRILGRSQTGGHAYFQRGPDVAVADDSLRDVNDPATTDDGLLLLDRTKIEKVALGLVGEINEGRLLFAVPVVGADGRASTVMATLREARALGRYLGHRPLRINVGDGSPLLTLRDES